MVLKTKTTDIRLFKLINNLRKLGRDKKVSVWGDIAKELARTRKNRAKVNLWKIDKEAEEGEYVVIPGKVLGDGELTKKVNVIAYNFSESSKEKIEKAGGKTFLIDEFVPKNLNQKVKVLK